MKNFTVSRLPALHFGAGVFIPSCEKILAGLHVRRIAVVTGGKSFGMSAPWQAFEALLGRMGIEFSVYSVSGEPSPEFVDGVRKAFGENPPDAVMAIGGGSALDAGKAVSATALEEGSVVEFLEGVGTRTPSGRKLPFVAVPTTAGTGSEATKNAVISRIGPDGFKKSLRHDAFIPDAAVVDAQLSQSCPPDVTAASGLDAVTQLLEAYVSPASSPFTDACAESGLLRAGRSFVRAFTDGGDLDARSGMAYAAYLSGVCLANAGLGVVHALASPLGALRPIPHGVICGTLLASSVRMTVEKLEREGGKGEEALSKYAKAGELLSGKAAADCREGVPLLLDTLEAWTEETGIARLAAYGVTDSDAAAVASRTVSKNHPAGFSEADLVHLLLSRL